MTGLVSLHSASECLSHLRCADAFTFLADNVQSFSKPSPPISFFLHASHNPSSITHRPHPSTTKKCSPACSKWPKGIHSGRYESQHDSQYFSFGLSKKRIYFSSTLHVRPSAFIFSSRTRASMQTSFIERFSGTSWISSVESSRSITL